MTNGKISHIVYEECDKANNKKLQPIIIKNKITMGLFNRLTDFGDREQVRAHAQRISIGIQQIENERSIQTIKGLSIAVRQEVQSMVMFASKLSQESINCLDVTINGRKMPFARFMSELTHKSVEIVNRGGYSII